MIKARHHILRIDRKEKILLEEYQKEAASCWNYILDVAKTFYEATNGKWIGKNELQKWLKGRFRLHSQTIQALTDKFISNRQTTAILRKTGNKKIKYPYRRKKYLTIPFKQNAIRYSARGSIILTLSAGVYFDTGFIPPSSVKTAEIIWRNGRYILSYTMDFPEDSITNNGILAGVDIGEIHPVAICSEKGDALVISGREIRSVKQWRNKALSVLSRKISRCKRGSKRFKRYVKAKKRIMNKSDNQIRNLIHHATRKAIDFCTAKGISELVIGDIVGVEKNTKKDKRLSRKSRQKISQMEYGRIRHYLEYKAREKGIETCFQNERNTSKECPVCGSINYPQGRYYRCGRCGYEGHRDAKAAFLILRKRYQHIPTPVFRVCHKQSIPKYRKSACVDGPDVVQSSSVIAEPLCGIIDSA